MREKTLDSAQRSDQTERRLSGKEHRAWNQKVQGHIPLTQLTEGAELYFQKSIERDAILPANKLTLSIK